MRQQARKPQRRDALSSTLGLLVFLVGIGLVGMTFWQAWDIFSRTPHLNMGVEAGKAVDFGAVAENLSKLIIRILLLVVMAGIGSALATRGVKMYASVSPVEPALADPGASDHKDEERGPNTG